MNRAWIDVEKHPPTEADADATGCVIVWHVYQGVMVIGWHQVKANRFFTHWMKPPEAPGNIAELRKRAERKP